MWPHSAAVNLVGVALNPEGSLNNLKPTLFPTIISPVMLCTKYLLAYKEKKDGRKKERQRLVMCVFLLLSPSGGSSSCVCRDT